MKKSDVVIIGAGPAGLTAAYMLIQSSDIKPIILEESENIGGISQTAVYKNNRMDLGGHRFFTKNEQVMKLWESLAPIQGAPAYDDILLDRKKSYNPGGPNPETEDKVMLKRNRVSRIYYLRKFFNYPVSLSIDTLIGMGFARTVKAGLGYIISLLKKRKENSLEDFYINRFGKPLYGMFFEGYTEKLWGVHPSEIAPDWGAQRVKGLSLLKAIVSIFRRSNETSLIEEFYYPKFGPGQLWEIMADEIVKAGGKIMLSRRVTKVNFSDNKVEIKALRPDNTTESYMSDAVFSSMAVSDLVSAMNNVPNKVLNIASKLPYRDFITVGLLVSKLKLKNETKRKTLSNIVPDCWIYVQENKVKLGRIQIFNNWSPYLVEKPEDTVWLGLEYFCNEGDELWSMNREDFIELAVNELCDIEVIDKADVIDATMLKVKKAYPAYFGSYNEFDTIKSYLNSFDNLYCIGRNGQHRYNNMDHSMLTSIEAVSCFLNNNKDKERIWNVNTEEEYHEATTNN